MRQDLWEAIRAKHPDYWSDGIRIMPDGYAAAIDQLFSQIEAISGGRQLIDIDLLAYPSGGIEAALRPRPDVDDITDAQKVRLFDYVKSWSRRGDQICQVCGRAPVSILKHMDGRDQEILCAEHMSGRRSAQ